MGEIYIKGVYKKLPSDRHSNFFLTCRKHAGLCGRKFAFPRKLAVVLPTLHEFFIDYQPLLLITLKKWNEFDYRRHEITFFCIVGEISLFLIILLP